MSSYFPNRWPLSYLNLTKNMTTYIRRQQHRNFKHQDIKQNIRKTCPCNEFPLKPHFYIEKLGFAGVYLFFLFFAPKHRLWVLVRTASARRFLRAPTIYVSSKNKKHIKIFLMKFSIFTGEIFFLYCMSNIKRTTMKKNHQSFRKGNIQCCG